MFCDNEMKVDSNGDDVIKIKVMIVLMVMVFVSAKVAIY